jgi:hypothetical protein
MTAPGNIKEITPAIKMGFSARLRKSEEKLQESKVFTRSMSGVVPTLTAEQHAEQLDNDFTRTSIIIEAEIARLDRDIAAIKAKIVKYEGMRDATGIFIHRRTAYHGLVMKENKELAAKEEKRMEWVLERTSSSSSSSPRLVHKDSLPALFRSLGDSPDVLVVDSSSSDGLAQLKTALENEDGDQIRVVDIDPTGSGEAVLRAFVLPGDLKWGFSNASKQDGSRRQNVLFRRLGDIHQERRELTLKALREGGKVMWIGTPGIGKTTSMFDLAMILIQHLGEDGWPKKVAVRVEDEVRVHTLAVDGVVHIRSHIIDGPSNIECALGRTFKEAGGVLLLEMEEEERYFAPFCGTFLTQPNRLKRGRGRTDYRSFRRTSGSHLLVVDPWSESEVKALAQCIDADGVEDIMTRFALVGGVPRCLVTNMDFEKRWGRILAVEDSNLLGDTKGTLDPTSVPPNFSLLVAPAVDQERDFGGDIADRHNILNAKFVPLSQHTAELLAEFAKGSPELMTLLGRVGVK